MYSSHTTALRTLSSPHEKKQLRQRGSFYSHRAEHNSKSQIYCPGNCQPLTSPASLPLSNATMALRLAPSFTATGIFSAPTSGGWNLKKQKNNISSRRDRGNLHNFYLNPDGSVECRRREWTRRLPFLCSLSAMRVQRSCRDRLWRRRSEKFIELLMSHKELAGMVKRPSRGKFIEIFITHHEYMAIIKHR